MYFLDKVISWEQFEWTEAVAQRCSEKETLRNSGSQENTCTRISFLIKTETYNFIKKETLAEMFSSEFCEISKNTFFHRTPLVAASVNL